MTFKNRLYAGITLLVCAAALLVATKLTSAGDLNPPAGPVAPTLKTLTEVEPRIAINTTNTPGDTDSLFKITQHGSFYLTGNITGVTAKHGIEITASGVTLDLNGFELLGVTGSLGGVSATVVNLNNIAVLNGSIRSWGGDGVDLINFSAINCRLADLRVAGNAGMGIRAGLASRITDCTAYSNTSNGINTANGCTITGCTAYDNAFNGINTGNACMINGCTAYSNTSNGIITNAGCTVSNCSAYQNSGSGINTGSGCTVTDCSARLNALIGITVVTGCTVAGCSARENTLDGIACISGCIIRDNTCSANGNGAGDGAGINTVSNDNRVEGNNCTGADRGIEVTAAGSVIIKNTCSGNAINWVIAANNVCGPILDRTSPGSAAISGNSALDSTGSTHPNANFSY